MLDITAFAVPDVLMDRQRNISTVNGGRRSSPFLAFGASAFLVVAATVIGTTSAAWLPATGLPLLFLTAVLTSAATFGLWPGIAAALFAFASYNFMFVQPLYTLRVNSAADILSLALFLFTASLTGWLAGKARDEADAANRRAVHLGVLSNYTSNVGDASAVATVFDAFVDHVKSITHEDVVVMQDELGVLTNIKSSGKNIQLDDFSLQACERAFRYGHGQPATAQGWQGSRFGFYPLPVSGKVFAVAGVRFPDIDRLQVSEIEQTVQTMVAQTVAALSRIDQAKNVDAARIRADQENLRATLLLSLSHDLRTPLATILGSVSSLRHLGSSLPADARDDLLQATEEETQRLSRYVEDLLTMTRLNTGLQPRLDWVDPADILNSAVVRAGNAHFKTKFSSDMKGSSRLIRCDAALLEQALFNLLDNAAKFAPADTIIRADLYQHEETLSFTIEDSGPGIPPAEQGQVFDPLFRGSDTTINGTGLGLAIVKGIVTLFGGSIALQSPLSKNGGTRFTLTLPTPIDAAP